MTVKDLIKTISGGTSIQIFADNKEIFYGKMAETDGKEIKKYSKQFEWKTVIEKFYIPSVNKIIENQKNEKNPGANCRGSDLNMIIKSFRQL